MSQAVRHGFHQDRLVQSQAKLPSLGGGGIHGEGVVSVDPDAVHAIPRCAGNDTIAAVLFFHRRAADREVGGCQDKSTWTFCSRGNLCSVTWQDGNKVLKKLGEGQSWNCGIPGGGRCPTRRDIYLLCWAAIITIAIWENTSHALEDLFPMLEQP